MIYNNLVQTPVKADQINSVLSKINKGICKPVTYTYFIEGHMGGKIAANLFLGFIPLPCKLNPTIVYEIVSVGGMPNDDNVLFNYATNNPWMLAKRTIKPFCVLHGVANVPSGSNNANGYSSRGCNPEMEIAVGSMVVEKPIFSQACVSAVDALSSYDPWHLDVGINPVSAINRTLPSAANYKQDYTSPTATAMPSFVLNVTVYYEDGIKI